MDMHANDDALRAGLDKAAEAVMRFEVTHETIAGCWGPSSDNPVQVEIPVTVIRFPRGDS